METYLVGGAVRDRLLGLEIKDRDWVVVGETPSSMQQAGFKSVGKDFPVFLHPQSHEEYALARTERKTGPGYHGFEFNTDSSVTLEQDLVRRDLTINAIAETENGEVIDPCNGQHDIEQLWLRHVSSAFSEDPVRILRTAKFLSRFAHLGFRVHESTRELMQSMVDNGEVDNLVPERVWQEFQAALKFNSPLAFFSCLYDANALPRIFPELESVLAANGHSSEFGESGAALNEATKLSGSAKVRFAAMCAHFPNEAALTAFCQRLRAPNQFRELAILCHLYADGANNALNLSPSELHALLKNLDVSRRAERFDDFLVASEAIQRASQTGNINKQNTNHLQMSAKALTGVDAAAIAAEQNNPADIAPAIKQAELSALDELLKAGFDQDASRPDEM